MKYMLMMNAPGGPYEILTKWPKPALAAHGEFMNRLNKKLADAGELVAGAGLTAPDQATLVRAGANAEPVTDGVFAESKEFLAGYWIVDVKTRERAYAIAAEVSMAPGPDGEPLHMAVEVREVMFAINPTSQIGSQ